MLTAASARAPAWSRCGQPCYPRSSYQKDLMFIEKDKWVIIKYTGYFTLGAFNP